MFNFPWEEDPWAGRLLVIGEGFDELLISVEMVVLLATLGASVLSAV